LLVAIKKCRHEKSVKSASQNIQNIFFVLKISKNIFLAGEEQEQGQGEEISLPVTSSQRFA
jgi:hypothetical protein